MNVPSPPIDLTTALPPSPPEFDEELRAALSALARKPDFGSSIRKNRVGGSPHDREAGALWLGQRLGSDLSAERVTVTNGTQSSLMLLLYALVGAGGVLAAEALTYVVLRTIAARLGISVVGVPLDEEGIIPAAFERVCRTNKPKALYCNPTVHNPTAAVMSERRRREVIAVAREHGVTIIEDDVLGAVHPQAPAPIAALAPDITWYVMSLSKCFAMGLRLAYLVAPSSAAAQELIDPVRRLSWWFPNSLSVEIASRWVCDGAGQRIAGAVRAEADARQSLAAQILDMRQVRTATGALHLWLHLPAGELPRNFADAAQSRGVLVRPAEMFSVAGAPTDNPMDNPTDNYVRVSMTGPPSRTELHQGLTILSTLLAELQRSRS